jgi:hypothetical protein
MKQKWMKRARNKSKNVSNEAPVTTKARTEDLFQSAGLGDRERRDRWKIHI